MSMLSCNLLTPWIANTLVLQFRDERDAGTLVLTPLYLCLGCSAPFWIDYNHAKHVELAFAGVISLGIGDTFAAIVGKK